MMLERLLLQLFEIVQQMYDKCYLHRCDIVCVLVVVFSRALHPIPGMTLALVQVVAL